MKIDEYLSWYLSYEVHTTQVRACSTHQNTTVRTDMNKYGK